MRVSRVSVELDDFGASKVVQSRSLCIDRVHVSSIRFYHSEGIPSSLVALRNLRREIPTGRELYGVPVWVSCDCEWFLYDCEVALNRYGCTDIRFSNGDYPVVRNSGMVPRLCKHLIALAPLAVAAKEKSNRPVSSPTYPVRPGPLPSQLQRQLERAKDLPSREELDEAMKGVTDFL